MREASARAGSRLTHCAKGAETHYGVPLATSPRSPLLIAPPGILHERMQHRAKPSAITRAFFDFDQKRPVGEK